MNDLHQRRMRGGLTAASALIIAALACMNAPAGTPPTATTEIVVDLVPAPTLDPALGTVDPSVTPEASLPPAPTATTDPASLPTATNAPPAAPEANVNYNGITFYHNNDLSEAWEVEIVPRDDPDSGAPESWRVPSHYRFTLTNYVLGERFHQPQILIFPIRNFEDYNQHGLDTINTMRTLLQEKPSEFPVDEAGANPIPFLPIFNAAQTIKAKVEYVQFQNGEGVRFLTQYGQAINPINNDELFYTFQGITYDDQYYVAVIMPVSHPDLLDEVTNEDYAAIEGRFGIYLTEITALLNAADNAAFTPDLSLLDEMVNSLTVVPAP